MSGTETRTQLLDAAQGFVQSRGFNAFSYKDLAESVGIRTASIHYHFAAKSDLALALMQRYLEDLNVELDAIDSSGQPARRRIDRFIDLYQGTARAGAICMCGSLASDAETLPEELRGVVSSYLKRTEEWITGTLLAGAKAGEFEVAVGSGASKAQAKTLAASLVAGLQGALILARAYGTRSKAIAPVKASFDRLLGGR